MKRFTIVIALLLVLFAANSLNAESLPNYSIETEVFQCDAVVTASNIEGDSLQVERVWLGSPKVGETLQIERFGQLSRHKFDDRSHAFRWMRGFDLTDRNKPVPVPLPPKISGRALFFLHQEKGKWMLQTGHCGVKWIVGDRVLGYQQIENPGGYFLLPEAEAASEAQLQSVVEAAIAKKAEWQRARQLADGAPRAQALAKFIAPQQQNFFYSDAALAALENMGALAAPALLAAAEMPKQNSYRREQLLQAFARSGAPAAAPYLSLLNTADGPRDVAQIYSVNGHPIEVELVPEKTSFMLGEPISLAFIVRNHSDEPLQVIEGGDYRNALGRPDSFKVAVEISSHGSSVVLPSVGPGFGGLIGPREVPAHGSYSFKLFLPHWVRFQAPGTYSIAFSRALSFPAAADDWDRKRGTQVPAKAAALVTVEPLDEVKMGAIIDDLGKLMLSGRRDLPAVAARDLATIDDARAIPYFVRAAALPDYSLSFAAIGALAKFDDADAFEALKKAMGVKAIRRDESLGTNIRLTAVHALARTPHAGGVEFLATQRHDSSEGVRVTIVQALGKLGRERAVPLLQEMTRDSSETVRSEAKRFLKSFE